MGELNNTVLAGVLIFVLGQIVSRFILDPLLEWRRLRGEISHALHFYGNVHIGERLHTSEFGLEVVSRYRDLASQLWQRAYSIPEPIFWIFSRFRIMPSWDAIREAATGLTGLSNSVFENDVSFNKEPYRQQVRKALRLRN